MGGTSTAAAGDAATVHRPFEVRAGTFCHRVLLEEGTELARDGHMLLWEPTLELVLPYE